MNIFQRLDKDPVYQALKDEQHAQWANYLVALERYEQKLKRLERAQLKASVEHTVAHEANQAAMRACNDYYEACERQQP